MQKAVDLQVLPIATSVQPSLLQTQPLGSKHAESQGCFLSRISGFYQNQTCLDLYVSNFPRTTKNSNMIPGPTFPSWWLNQPLEKYARQNGFIFPK